MARVLEVSGLCKHFGNTEVLRNVDISIDGQEIVGFLGSNGSGKSTTLKCIAGLYTPSCGTITVGGYDIERQRAKALDKMGISIEAPSLYPNLTGYDHLRLVANWRGAGRQRIDAMVAYSGLGHHINKRTRTYSMGMKMRLMLSLALMSKPPLLILDEPMNGLDLPAVVELREQMQRIRAEGTSILFSSHQLSEVEKIVDRVIILDRGQVAFIGVIPSSLGDGEVYHCLIEGDIECSPCRTLLLHAAEQPHAGKRWVDMVRPEGISLQAFIAQLNACGIQVWDITKRAVSLEDFYQYIYAGRGQYGQSIH